MKVYIDLQKLAISKVVDGTSPEYAGDINSNVFEILFFNYDNTNWFPTMSQLAPNGREAGDFEADSLGVGETHDYTEDGVNYQRFTFTMGSAWVLMKGRSNLYVWYNVLNGAVLKKCVGKLNVMLNESSDNYFISNPTFNPAVKTYIDDLASDIEDELNDKIDAQNATIASLSQSSPSVFDTAANIQLLQENKGVAVATDTGYIWYWDTTITPNAYVSSGLQYNSLANYTKHSGSQLQDANGNNIYPVLDDGQVGILKISNNLKSYINHPISLVYEQGAISGGYESDNAYRIRTNYIRNYDSDYMTIFVSSGYFYSIQEYDENLSYLTQSGSWQTETQIMQITKGHYYRLVVRKADSSGIVPSDGANITISFMFSESINKNTRKLNYIFNNENNFTWEKGAISSGADQSNNYRLRTVGYYQFTATSFTISVPNGFKISYTEYNPDKTFLSQGASWENTYTLNCNPTHYYRFVMKRDDGAEMRVDYGSVVDLNVNGIYYVVNKIIKENRNSIIESNFTPSKFRIAGHRGAMEYYPENTIPSFEKACQLGCWGVETDVRETSDGYLVCMHDASVDRTTDGTGNVSSLTLAQIRALHIDYGDVYGSYTGNDLQVPTFDEYLKVCHKYGKMALVHLQSLGNTYNLKVYNVIKGLGMLNSVIFQSWNVDDIKYLKSIDKNIFGCTAYNSVTQAIMDELLSMGGSLGFHVNTYLGIDTDLIKYAKNHNLYIFVDPTNNVDNWIDRFVDVGTATYISEIDDYLLGA